MTWVWPPGVTDPIFLCELALALGMTVSEIGERMSRHELEVVWPAYFAYKARAAAREADKNHGRVRL
jgi:hypothetical protein